METRQNQEVRTTQQHSTAQHTTAHHTTPQHSTAPTSTTRIQVPQKTASRNGSHRAERPASLCAVFDGSCLPFLATHPPLPVSCLPFICPVPSASRNCGVSVCVRWLCCYSVSLFMCCCLLVVGGMYVTKSIALLSSSSLLVAPSFLGNISLIFSYEAILSSIKGMSAYFDTFVDKDMVRTQVLKYIQQIDDSQIDIETATAAWMPNIHQTWTNSVKRNTANQG